MITKGEKVGFIVIAIVAITTFIFWKDIPSFSNAANTEKVKEEKDKKGDKKNYSNDAEFSSQVKIVHKWDLPSVLKEVSGIAYIDNQRFACVQDEEGKIFIFNTALKKIEKEISFGAPGDYEGITLNGSTAYVVRADGRLFETDMSGAKSDAKEYPTSLTVEQNIEGLCFDKNNNRLLLAIKGDEPGKPGYKGIYAFDIATKKFVKEPVFKINMADAAFNSNGGKKNKAFMPSAISIHPVTNEFYITDGTKSLLLTMNASGDIQKLYNLGKGFTQPEGITFNPQGEMFISNEGTKQPGNILKVALTNE